MDFILCGIRCYDLERRCQQIRDPSCRRGGAGYNLRSVTRGGLTSDPEFPFMQSTITVRVPASTSNLGSWFRLPWHCASTLQRRNRRSRWTARLTPMMRESGRRFFEAAAVGPFKFSVSIAGNVPCFSRPGEQRHGATRVMHALNELTERNADARTTLRTLRHLEGHPDNAAPAEFGGFTVARDLGCQQFSVSARASLRPSCSRFRNCDGAGAGESCPLESGDLMRLRVPGTRVPSPPRSLRASIGNCAARLGTVCINPSAGN